MEVDSEDVPTSSSGDRQRTHVFARLGHAGLSPLVLGEVHPPAGAAPASYRGEQQQLQQLYLNSLYSHHQVSPQYF